MLNSAIIEVIIGMIFVYSLLAILVTQINTVISNVLNLRARHLKRAVQDLITDPTTQARFLTHPLVCLVKRPLNPNRPLSAQGAELVVESGTTDVAWIEPRVFADVMTELVAAQAGLDRDLYAPLLRVADTVLNNAEKAQINNIIRRLQTTGAGRDALYDAILKLPDSADRQALFQALNDIEASAQEFRTDSPELISVLRGLRKIENPDFQRALDTILASARSIDDAKDRLERWFDNNMEQVTDNYKRMIQYISLGVGLGLALILNVDSLHLARTLWDDPALRETVVVAARASIESGELAAQMEVAAPEATPAVVIDANAASLPPGDADGVVIEATPDPTVTTDDIADAQQKLDESVERTQQTVQNLLDLRLPIGWGLAPVVLGARNPLDPDPLTDARNLWNYFPPNNPAHWLGLWLRKVIGIIITTIAVSQGAPFWFDLMNRIARGGKS